MITQKQQTLEDLRQRSAALDNMLRGDVCKDPKAAAVLLDQSRSSPINDGAMISLPEAAQSASMGSEPPPPAVVTPTGPEATPLRRQDLVARVHEAVVLVIAEDGTGSGFFVTPDVVLTNNHVVENHHKGSVIVVGRGLPQPMEATIVARTRGSAADDQRDYAILKVSGAHIAHPLPMTAVVSELTAVVAAGYPGLLLQTDNNFSSLIRGDMTAMPELVLTQGSVMALQNRSRGLATIAHTAPISGGNSGGPLIDTCGRVVGINSFITVDVEQATNAGFALTSADLIRFVGGYGITPTQDNRACGD
jgi:S1-C subfamily serine protease